MEAVSAVNRKFTRVLALLAQAALELKQLNETNQIPESYKPLLADTDIHLRQMLIPLCKVEKFLFASPKLSAGVAIHGN